MTEGTFSQVHYFDKDAAAEPLIVLDVAGQNVAVYAVPRIARGSDGILTPSLDVTMSVPHLLPGIDRRDYLNTVEDCIREQLITRYNVMGVLNGGLYIESTAKEHSEREASDFLPLLAHPAFFESRNAFNESILMETKRLRSDLKKTLESDTLRIALQSEGAPSHLIFKEGKCTLFSLREWGICGGPLNDGTNRELPEHCIGRVSVPRTEDLIQEPRLVQGIRAVCRELNLDMAPVKSESMQQSVTLYLQANRRSAEKLNVLIQKETGAIVHMQENFGYMPKSLLLENEYGCR